MPKRPVLPELRLHFLVYTDLLLSYSSLSKVNSLTFFQSQAYRDHSTLFQINNATSLYHFIETLYCLTFLSEYKLRIILKTKIIPIRTQKLVSTRSDSNHYILPINFLFLMAHCILYCLGALELSSFSNSSLLWENSSFRNSFRICSKHLTVPIYNQLEIIPFHPPKPFMTKQRQEPNQTPFKRRPVLWDAGSSLAAGSVPVVPGGSA